MMHKSSKFRLFLFFPQRVSRHPHEAAEGNSRKTRSINVHILYTNYDCTLAPLGGSGGSNLIKLVFLSLVSGMILADAPIALIFSPTRNDLPYKELSINFAFKISRAVT